MRSVISGHCMSAGGILLESESEIVSVLVSNLDQYYGRVGADVVAFPSVDILPPIGYLRVEFPSEFWYLPNVATIVTYSLAQFFVSLLPNDPRIEHVYWFAEDDVLKVWTVIPEPDFSLERPLYEGQVFFMEKFPEYDCDFSVIYRFGKSLDDIKPHGGHPVL